MANRRNRRNQANAATTTQSGPSYQQGLKIAGQDGISRSEYKTLTENKTPAQFLNTLSKLNTNLKSNDQMGITLRSGAVNTMLKQAQSNPMSMIPTGQSFFGDSRLGNVLQSRLGTPGTPGYGSPTGYRSPTAGTGTQFLAGGMELRPGGRERVIGSGNQYEYMPRQTGGDGTQGTTPESGDGTPGAVNPETIPGSEGTDTIDTTTTTMPGITTDLMNWATSFRAKKSSRKRSGARAQGLASQKVAPNTSWQYNLG